MSWKRDRFYSSSRKRDRIYPSSGVGRILLELSRCPRRTCNDMTHFMIRLSMDHNIRRDWERDRLTGRGIESIPLHQRKLSLSHSARSMLLLSFSEIFSFSKLLSSPRSILLRIRSEKTRSQRRIARRRIDLGLWTVWRG